VAKVYPAGELRLENVGEEVIVNGWVNNRRDLGGLIFIVLRDRSGLVQVAIDPRDNPEAHAAASDVRNEYVLRITGTVRNRPEGTINEKLPTGKIEIVPSKFEILNPAKPLPFQVNDNAEVDELQRLRYRYLDLRRPFMQHNLIMRHRVTKYMRDYLDERGFLEIETPILIKSTPEGARDYLVPSRVHPGEFYALPQSPQQLKQLLMVSGIEKYFQIARCFRDEDLRADRQPEFTQLDIEMSFIQQEDILQLLEGLYTGMAQALRPDKKILQTPFPRFSYDESMARFGNDKPDIRFGMELKDISDLVKESEFKVFSGAIAAGGQVKGLLLPGCGSYSRRELDGLVEFVKQFGAKGLAYLQLEGSAGSLTSKSPAAKFFTPELLQSIAAKFGPEVKGGDLLVFVADQPGVVANALGRLRNEMGKRLNLIDQNVFAFCWVTDFPLLEWNADENRWDAVHHPFTAPKPEDVPFLETDPGKAKANAYDMVCNGYETAGGSIRIHNRDVQTKMFALMSYSLEDTQARFGHMLNAFEYGAPPHGGIAAGLDRTIMLFTDEENIRNVIAFPKTQSATDEMTQAPSPVDARQLKELHIALALPPEKKAGQAN
jgi:aspartyl-tRNA synthetase